MSALRQTWTVQCLSGQLHALGIHPGDRLFVHTGLRALRLPRRDVPNLLAAYLHVLGPTGALFFPTHTYSYKGEKGSPIFDQDAPCHPLIGVWPELARIAPGVIRSLHPTHAIAGVGAGVRKILAGHEGTEAAGFGSPLGKLQQVGAKVLMAGCGFESCTLLHLAETYAQVPHLRLPQDDVIPIALARRGRRIIEIPQHEMPGCSDGFPKFEPRLRALGLIRDGALGEGHAMLCEMKTLLDAAISMLKENPLGFLCDDKCATCDAARREAVRFVNASTT
ncbi:MAG: AAC(3) family N-acetyltransferase [Candidatus Hydrogenedentes bacterium]|nr:AAC(3) family N-acetyltransferase [Candidatus Hydrogenedentota bacterium]